MCTEERPAGHGDGVVVGGARHPPRRNLRARLAALQRARGQGDGEDLAGNGSSNDDNNPDYGVEEREGEKEEAWKKVGTKKLKRIQEKAERKAAREVWREGLVKVG